MKLSGGQKGAKVIARAQDMSFAYKGCSRFIVKDAAFYINRGDKIALMGPNGCGKTTLINLLAGMLRPEGTLRVNPNANIGCLTQMLGELDLSQNAQKTVSKNTGLTWSEARNLLGQLGISGGTQLLPLSKLSIGERSRVALSCLAFSSHDLLLLDEPTNHLDAPAREGVEAALAAFSGAVVAATHDRYFSDRFATRVWYLEGGRLTTYEGTYKDYQRGRAVNEEAEELAARTKLAFLASKLSIVADSGEKAALESEWTEALRQLDAATRRSN